MSGDVDFGGTRLPPDAEVVELVNVSPADLEPLRGLPRLRELRLRHTNPHRTPGGLPRGKRS